MVRFFTYLIMARFLSLNVNGLRDPVKRAAFLRWLLLLQADIICLQETHSSSTAEATSWFSSSGFDVVASHGSVKSAGACILYKRHCRLIDSFTDDAGRFASCKLDLNGKLFQVASIYAPNRNPERNDFFESLPAFLDESLPTLLTGDFNAVFDPTLDRRGGAPSPYRESVASLTNLFSLFGCSDVWRAHHPGLHSYSWSSHDGTIASRIDLIGCPHDWVAGDSSSELIPCPFSDHCAVSARLSIPESIPRGPGFWKLNCSLLSDPEYISLISNFWLFWKSRVSSFPSLLYWWDEGKEQIKRLSIKFSSTKRSLAHKDRHRLENYAAELKGLLDGGQTSVLSDYKEVLQRIEDLDLASARGAQIRSRARWVEEGETSSSYFCRLERKHSNDCRISGVRRPDDSICSSLPEIISAWKSFYMDLFSSTHTDPATRASMFSHLESTLSPEESDNCEGVISSAEALEALKGMARNKSPGIDGLPAEFYLAFWNTLGEDLVCVLNHAFQSGHLSVSQSRGLIRLLFKRGDRFAMENWRPITLLCADYKIAARVIAGRLLRVIGSVVSPDQSCGVPGRYIGENVALLRDVSTYASSRNLPVAILSLDQEKAFDRVEWSFIFDTLRSMGFGPSFIAWVQLLYSLPQSSVLVNGYQSEFFSPSRGVRQGCPLSPLLYVLTAEVLACNIRANASIEGLLLPSSPGRQILLSQYADDTSVIVSSDQSIRAVFDTFHQYELASGARVNIHKSKGLWLGSWAGRTDPPVNLDWSSVKLKTLGVHIGPGNLSEDNWNPRIEAVSNTLDSWRQRSLSFQGRLMIINMLALSRIWYVGSLVPAPQWVISKLNTLVFSFFWKGKKDLVARKAVCLPKPAGGFGVVNIPLKLASLQVLWVKRLVTSSHPWRFLLFDWFPDHRNYLGNPVTAVPRVLPEFYKSVFAAWSALKGGLSPSSNSLAIASDSPSEAIELVRITVKACYSLLLQLNTTEPHCVQHFRPSFGNLYWRSTWEQVHLFPQDRPSIDIAWKVAHGVLYTAERLLSFGYNFDPSCFCGAHLESLSHLFFDCPLAQSGLARIEFHLHSAVPVAPSITCRHVLFGFSPDELLAVPPVFVYLLHLLKYYIWRSRNDFRFRNLNPSAIDLIASVETRFRFNLSIFARHVTSARARRRFVRLWGANGHFFQFDGDRLSFARF